MPWKNYRDSKLDSFKKAVLEGKVDRPIMNLLEKINQNQDLVTLSSCSGRIDLLVFDMEKRKGDASHYAKWHEPVVPEELEMKLCSYTGKLPLWFKTEPFILHVAAKDVDSALQFMKKIRDSGVKRGGIQGIGKEHVVMEFQGTGVISFPVDPVRGEWNEFVKIANAMMRKNMELVKKLEKVEW